MGIGVLRVGVVCWWEGDGIAAGISRTLECLGHEAINLPYDARLPPDLDAVFARGPFGSLVPLAHQLLACLVSRRPPFILWMTEQLPNPDWPEWVRRGVGLLRSRAERLAYHQRAPGEWRLNPRLRWMTGTAHRFRYYGDLYWLHRQGVLSVLVTGSAWTADFLRARGFDPLVSPPCCPRDWGADLGLERDVPVLWMGRVATVRRGRLLKRLRAELRERGVEMLMVDGVENPYVFGEARTRLLNRTKVAVNLLREKWDDNSMRYRLAALNRALIVTEPALPHTPFLPGVHLVEAPMEQMADTICYYLSHEEDRRRIADRAHQLVTEHPMEGVVAQILERAAILRQKAMP